MKIKRARQLTIEKNRSALQAVYFCQVSALELATKTYRQNVSSH